MKKLWSILIVMGILMLAGNTEALLYTYDFSSMGYSEGQNFEGVTLDYATFTSETHSLQYTTGYGGGIYGGYDLGGTSDIYIDFSVAVNQISITAGDGAGDLDAFAVTLYEYGSGDLLGTWNSPQFGGSNEPEWYPLDISALNIGRVVFDPGNSGVLPGQLGPPYGGMVMTELSYNTSDIIPELSTMLLLGTGLIGLAALGRKKFLKK